jgi:hypothetical protein
MTKQRPRDFNGRMPMKLHCLHSSCLLNDPASPTSGVYEMSSNNRLAAKSAGHLLPWQIAPTHHFTGRCAIKPRSAGEFRR